jgi:hypothetical protein
MANSDMRLSRRATGKVVQNQLALELREAGDRVVGRKVPPIWGPSRGAVDVGVEGARWRGMSLRPGLCELGSRIWEAIQSDDAIADRLFTLVDMKLALDNVTLLDDSRLDPDAAKAILMDVEDDATNSVRPKRFVPPSEWAKLALYNLAMDWVMDQAPVRMKLESKWPFQQQANSPMP